MSHSRHRGGLDSATDQISADQHGSGASNWVRLQQFRFTPKSRSHTQQTSLRSGWTPTSDITRLLDHLVGAGEQRRRDGEAERLGRPQVDEQFRLR
jgi:hypothetical protein